MNLLDTGVIIEMIQTKCFRPGIISPITLIEVLRGFDDAKRVKVSALFEKSFQVLNLNDSVVETYCILYRKLKKDGTLLPDADLLIAATAIAYDLKLETSDRHFERLCPFGLRLK